MRTRSLFVVAFCLVVANLPAASMAQNREATLAALMKLPPAERHARLVEGAKKESGLVWYSSTTANCLAAASFRVPDLCRELYRSRQRFVRQP